LQGFSAESFAFLSKNVNNSFTFLLCDIWSLTLREEYRLRMVGNRVLKTIFGPKRKEITGGWNKLHNVELHNLYSSQN
jgi:hypothetical protein